MDKSWIMKPQGSDAYKLGVKEFIKFAFKDKPKNIELICPCKYCGFKKPQSMSVMSDHLSWSPFPTEYTIWLHHGETLGKTSTIPNIGQDAVVFEDSIQNMINDAFGVDRDKTNEVPVASNVEINQDEEVMPTETQERNEAKEFYELTREGEQPLYEGCTKYSRLSFLVKLYHIKCLCGMSDKSMTMILELLKDAFEFAKIPSSFYEAKKTITKLGLNYVKIPACPNNCMLYWGEDEERETCKKCNTSKWKSKAKDSDGNKQKKVPAKVLRYFPLKPRLQRLFLSSKTAEDMRWHAVDPKNDGMMRHPRDSKAWKEFDLTHPWFASDPRNVRLALASDGFNPFGMVSTNYSIWPVMLIPYNTPPWVCMKSTSFIMSMIIPGKKMPGNDIDVYLQPLIKELKELWTTGVVTHDSFKKERFTLHATLMWTISDFPGLGALSGWNTYTGFACPSFHRKHYLDLKFLHKFYDQKIKTKFVVNDEDNKKYILKSIATKWRNAKSQLFKKYYKWDLTLEENLRNYPRCIDPNNWAAFVQYRRKPKTVEMARKNAANRAKLKMNHTLGTKSIARTQEELEKRSGRKYSRGDMFGVSHKKPNGSFVNDEAKKKNDQLQAEIAKTHLENEAFVGVFGKEHGGFARSMGLGVTPSQLTTTRSPTLTSSSEDKEKMKQMQAEIDSLKDKALQVDILKEQVAFLMQKHNSNGNQVPE
ncbi:hypothetical protein QL285_021384 [Trifolium repens]|nr:hypothetical protein QL285_021384 [Trifolium repens]